MPVWPIMFPFLFVCRPNTDDSLIINKNRLWSMFAGSDGDSCVSLHRSSNPSGSLGGGLPKASQAATAHSRESSASEQGELCTPGLLLRMHDYSLVHLHVEIWLMRPFGFPSAPSQSAAVAEAPCDASCSSAVGGSSVSASAGRSFEAGPMASAATEIIEPEATEETSGGCRRSEAAGEGKSQPTRGSQDSDDSDDDPILIPPSRLSEQGQRYPPNAFTATLFFPFMNTLLYFWYVKLFFF